MLQFAVFGNPISHSLSPQIHQLFAKQFGLAIDYQKICAPIENFEEIVNAFSKQGGHGANITLPFKQRAAEYADELTERAKQASAVNTFIFSGDQCIGDNTDGIGLLRDLAHLNIDIKNKRILILGAGGAACGIIRALQMESPSCITIFNRTESRAEKLSEKFDCAVFSKDDDAFDLLINTTSSDFENESVFSALNDLSSTHCYDLNYAARHQSFAKWACDRQAKSCHDGLGMLIEQAAESFFLWTGCRADSHSVRRALRLRSGSLQAS